MIHKLKHCYYKVLTTINLVILSASSQAGEYTPKLNDQGPPTFNSVTDNVMGPIEIVRHLFNAASVILGFYLILAAVQGYLKHRKSPHEAPLSNVIVGVILGSIFMVLPFTYELAKAGNEQLGIW